MRLICKVHELPHHRLIDTQYETRIQSSVCIGIVGAVMPDFSCSRLCKCASEHLITLPTAFGNSKQTLLFVETCNR